MSKKDPFDSLFENVYRMGAPIRHADLELRELDKLDELSLELEAGKEIDINDLDDPIEYGGLLSYKQNQVLLYIPDHGRYVKKAIDQPSKGNKYHVADCAKLQEMRSNNRIERYIATTHNKKEFDIFGSYESTNIEGKAELNICRFCLSKLNYKGYASNGSSNRNHVFEEFDRDDFFETYSSFFPFSTNKLNRNNSGYPKNWPEISNKYREKADYVCELCKVNLKHNKRLLDVHHINGVKSDTKPTNLQVLCRDCHRKQPYHSHMGISPSELKTIRDLRKAGGVDIVNTWQDAFILSDPAYHGVLHKLKAKNTSLPVVGFILDDPNTHSQVSIEIAWPGRNKGVVNNTSTANVCKQLGWTVKLVAEYL